jgi:hypothetical protein
LFTLHTLLNAIISCSQLNTHEVFRRYPREWIISHRCSWMAVYVFCCNAQSKSHSDLLDITRLSLFYQLPNCNLFTQHVLFILWRDTASELWTPVLFPSYCYHLFTLLALFTLLTYFHYFPLDTLIPFISSKPVRLTTSSQVGNKVLGCVCAGYALLLAKDESTSIVKRRPCWSVIKPVRITFSRLSLLS